jgi:hypothetical protein
MITASAHRSSHTQTDGTPLSDNDCVLHQDRDGHRATLPGTGVMALAFSLFDLLINMKSIYGCATRLHHFNFQQAGRLDLNQRPTATLFYAISKILK